MKERARQTTHGFTLIELMITVVFTTIAMAAFVVFFGHALKTTSADEYRVNAANIAQDRLEQVRLLDYADITAANLNYSPAPPGTFGDGRFGPTYTLAGHARPYQIQYEVDPASEEDAPQKYVKVSVSRPGGYVTTADTIIENPAAGGYSTLQTRPTYVPDLTMTVYFTNWQEVDGNGVWFRRVQTNVTPAATTTPTPIRQYPSSGHEEVTWTGLEGGPHYTYTIFVDSSRATYTLACPPFRLWKSGRIKFDTYPGGD